MHGDHVRDVVDQLGQVAGEVGVPGVAVDQVGALDPGRDRQVDRDGPQRAQVRPTPPMRPRAGRRSPGRPAAAAAARRSSGRRGRPGGPARGPGTRRAPRHRRTPRAGTPGSASPRAQPIASLPSSPNAVLVTDPMPWRPRHTNTRDNGTGSIAQACLYQTLTPVCGQIRLNVLFGAYEGRRAYERRKIAMVLASRSTGMRRAGAFLALVAFEILAVVVLHRLGELSWLRIPFDDLEGWLQTSAPEDVLAAVVRLIALGAAWWLLGSTALYALARISRIPGAVRAVEWFTLPSVRRLADQALALTLATSIVSGGASAALANPTGLIPTPPAAVVTVPDPLAAWTRVSTFGYRPTATTPDDPIYQPEPAGGPGPAAGARGPDGGRPSYHPEAAGERKRGRWGWPASLAVSRRPAPTPRPRRDPRRRRAAPASHRRPPARRRRHRRPARPRRRRPRPCRRRPRHRRLASRRRWRTSRGRPGQLPAPPARRHRRGLGIRPRQLAGRRASPARPTAPTPACTVWPRATTCGRSPATIWPG